MSQFKPSISSSLLICDTQGEYRKANAEEVLQAARRVLGNKVRRGCTLSSPNAVRDYLALQLGALEHEVFAVVFLDAQNKLLAFQEMFRGTITQTSVYPREVAKESGVDSQRRCSDPRT